MRIFRHRTDLLEGSDHVADPSPWVDGHASPEDRALGFELELIELVRRRSEAAPGGATAASLDQEIASVRAELGAVLDETAPLPHVA